MQTALIQRYALLERLGQALDSRVVLMVAPPGCGKTTLVKQLLEARAASIIWMRVIESSTPDALLADMLVGLAKLLGFSEFGTRSLYLSTDALIREVKSYVKVNFEKDLVFVFDDVQHLVVASVFFDALFKGLPKSCRFVLIARELPRLDYVQLKLEDEFVVFIEDLYFSRDEVYQTGKLVLGEQVSLDFLERVWRELRGWPMGTIAYFEAGDGYTKSIHGQLFSGFAEEMMGKLLPNQRQRVLEFAAFEELTVEISREIWGISDDELFTFLSSLREKGFFVYEENSRYRFHDLFREFLLRELETETPARLRELRVQLGFWLYKKGNVKRAIAEFLAIRDYVRVFEFLISEFDLAPQFLDDESFIGSIAQILLDPVVREKLWEDLGLPFASVFVRFFRLHSFNNKDMLGRILESALNDVMWDASPYHKFMLRSLYTGYLFQSRNQEKFDSWSMQLIADFEGYTFSEGELIEVPLVDRLFSPLDRILINRGNFHSKYEDSSEVFKLVIERLGERLDEMSVMDYYQTYILAGGVFRMVAGSKDLIMLPIFSVLRNIVVEYPGTFVADDCFLFLAESRDEAGLSLEECFAYFSSMQSRLSKGSFRYGLFALEYSDILVYLGDLERAYQHRLSCFGGSGLSVHRRFADTYYLSLILFGLGQKASILPFLENALAEARQQDNGYFEKIFSDFCLLFSLDSSNAFSVSKDSLSGVHTSDYVLFFAAYLRRDYAEMNRVLQEHLEKSPDLEFFTMMYVFVLGYDAQFAFDEDFVHYPAIYVLYKRVFAARERYQMSLEQSGSPASIRVSMLGTEVVQVDGSSVDYRQWLGSKNRLIFYYLLLQGSGSSEDLGALLWSEKDSKFISSNLRKVVQWLQNQGVRPELKLPI